MYLIKIISYDEIKSTSQSEDFPHSIIFLNLVSSSHFLSEFALLYPFGNSSKRIFRGVNRFILFEIMLINISWSKCYLRSGLLLCSVIISLHKYSISTKNLNTHLFPYYKCKILNDLLKNDNINACKRNIFSIYKVMILWFMKRENYQWFKIKRWIFLINFFKKVIFLEPTEKSISRHYWMHYKKYLLNLLSQHFYKLFLYFRGLHSDMDYSYPNYIHQLH